MRFVTLLLSQSLSFTLPMIRFESNFLFRQLFFALRHSFSLSFFLSSLYLSDIYFSLGTFFVLEQFFLPAVTIIKDLVSLIIDNFFDKFYWAQFFTENNEPNLLIVCVTCNLLPLLTD